MRSLILAVGLGCATQAWADTVTIGAEDDWAPYCAKVGNEAKGFAVDIVREAFKAAGVDVKFAVVPYARCMSEAKDGKLAGCFDAARNSLLENDYLWHAKPMFTAAINIYAPADSKESGLRPKDLEGKDVAVTNNYEYGDDFDRNTRIKRSVSNQDEQGFRKLLAKRVQYMVAYEKVANDIFAKNKADFTGKFNVVGTTAEPGLYIAFSKKTPDGAKYLEKFNQGLETIRKNGKYKTIEAAYP
ncbi:transporter substrate-binding domain-containing protein [Chitinimonas arctica]|uniref:Transporter substrate-binding domain-containing protein n=1 Tax=Chitinimonas arctica TaxID=2594795 RepID=A0A516SDA4_9NEIS|nr:transporter substrate-binding domain-containing protein [Chitinimonas arctica]QDQ26120.1 transporter substrate-binding domain-containing protein [Chitinimonas arctica]